MTVIDYIGKTVSLCQTNKREYLVEFLELHSKDTIKDMTLEEAARYYDMLSHRLGM